MKLPWLKNPPALSVIIPAFNRPRELQLCLEGFARQTSGRENFEVIVIHRTAPLGPSGGRMKMGLLEAGLAV